jgi:hypothetical protein
VVDFRTIPLVGPSQKTLVLLILGTKKNRKSTFYLASKNSLVTKVVGLGRMHMSAKNGVKI